VKELLFESPKRFEIQIVSELMKEENEKLKKESTDKINYVSSDEIFKKKMTLYPDYPPQLKP